MTKTAEELKREMYGQLSCTKFYGNQYITGFESALEAYLEALRQDHVRLTEERDCFRNKLQAFEFANKSAGELLRDTLVQLDHTKRMQAVYSDAYDRQTVLTKNACSFDRERWDELYQLRDEVKSVERDREDTYESLQEASTKLASQTQTIIALHTVVKDQQTALTRLQGHLHTCENERSSYQAQAHKEIMQAERISDERWEQLQSKQKFIVSQRKTIELLTFELESVRKQAEKRSFWRFFGAEKRTVKPLPEKII